MTTAGEIRARLVLESRAFEAGMRRAREEMEESSRSANRTRDSLDAIQKASLAVGTAVVAGIGASVKVASDFEQAMAKVKAVSGATDEQFIALEKTARELGATTQFSASEAAEGMNFLAMAGFEVSEIVASMPGVLNLAAAAAVDLGTSSDIVSNIMTGFGMSAGETGRAVDVLVAAMTTANTDLPQLGQAMKYVAPVASALGLDIEDTATAIAKMSDAGIQGSQAGTALRAMLLSLTNPTGQTVKAMEDLGIKVTDADGAMKPLPELIGHISERMDGMTEAQLTQTAAQLVGTEAASGFLALLSVGEDGLADYAGELRNSAGAAEEMAKIQNDTVNGAFKAFQSALSEVGISVGREFLPVIRDLVDRGTDILRIFGELDPRTVALGLKMAGAAASVGIAVTSLLKLGTAIGGLFAAMGPAGWIIIGLAAVAAGAVAVHDSMTRAKEVNLDVANSLIEQEGALRTSLDRYEELDDKLRLTNDELAEFADLQSRLKSETDPTVIETLAEKQAYLTEKSGLTNGELTELLELNDRLVKELPDSTVKITDQGNVLLDNADALRGYNEQQRERLRLELDSQLAKAEANRLENLQKQKQLVVEIEGHRKNVEGIEGNIDAKTREIKDTKAEIAKAERENNEHNRLFYENSLALQERELQSLRDSLATEWDRLITKQETLDITEEELSRIEEIKGKLVEVELAEVGINAKKDEGLDKVNEAIAKEEEVIAKLRESQNEQAGLTGEVQKELNERETNLAKLRNTRTAIENITGAQKKTSVAIYMSYLEAKKLDDSLKLSDYLKKINVTDDGTIADLERRATRPVYKRVSITESITQKYNLTRPKKHQGGTLVDLAPLGKLHNGGATSQFLQNAPMHNEVDVRLLRNEMVLTEGQQANLFRMLESGQSTQDGARQRDYSPEMVGLLQRIESAVRESGGGASISVDGYELGRIIEPYVSREQANEFNGRQFRDGEWGR
jgi:TP901 family phage tail tape measure protein